MTVCIKMDFMMPSDAPMDFGYQVFFSHPASKVDHRFSSATQILGF